VAIVDNAGLDRESSNRKEKSLGLFERTEGQPQLEREGEGDALGGEQSPNVENEGSGGDSCSALVRAPYGIGDLDVGSLADQR